MLFCVKRFAIAREAVADAGRNGRISRLRLHLGRLGRLLLQNLWQQLCRLLAGDLDQRRYPGMNTGASEGCA